MQSCIEICLQTQRKCPRCGSSSDEYSLEPNIALQTMAHKLQGFIGKLHVLLQNLESHRKICPIDDPKLEEPIENSKQPNVELDNLKNENADLKEKILQLEKSNTDVKPAPLRDVKFYFHFVGFLKSFFSIGNVFGIAFRKYRVGGID